MNNYPKDYCDEVMMALIGELEDMCDAEDEDVTEDDIKFWARGLLEGAGLTAENLASIVVTRA